MPSFNRNAFLIFSANILTLRDQTYFRMFGELNKTDITKQLLDEVEHDIMNYQNRGLCYLLKPEADNADTRF